MGINLPKWEELSKDEQIPIVNLPLEGNFVVIGGPGTGKTISLKVLAEQFSEQGVPVFLADVKGDLASLAERGVENPVLYL